MEGPGLQKILGLAYALNAILYIMRGEAYKKCNLKSLASLFNDN